MTTPTNDPTQPVFNVTTLPPEVQEGVEKAKTFYQRNKKAVHITAGAVVLLVLHKRGVNKAVVKALNNSIPGLPSGMTTVSEHPAKELMVDDWFKVGGKLYRVLSKSANDFGEVVTRIVNPSDAKEILYVVFTPETTLETFNQ